jgi:hypothetical protein
MRLRRPLPAASPGARALDDSRAGGARSGALRLALASGVVAAALLGLTTLARGESQLPPAADAAPAATDPDGFQADFGLASRRLADAGEARYFVLRPGFQKVLASDPAPAGGLRRVLGRLLPRGAADRTVLTVTVLDETREVDGVVTRVVEEREEKDGELHEIALNFFAIDPQTGDAFYFGEDVSFFEGGRVVDHAGTWLAGGPNRPGLIMPGTPAVGMKYYQELAPDAAMDRAEVVSTSEQCSTPAGAFDGCLVTRETTPLEPKVVEHKSYAPGLGLVQDQALRLVRYGDVAPAQPRR